MPSITRSTIVAGLAALLTLPAIGSDTESERTRPTALAGSTITWCGEVELITADPELYGDSPVYLGNPPTGKVMRWARSQPGFQELWIDRDNFGWVTLGFTEGVEERQADLEREFPSLGVVAVKVPYTRRELSKLQKRVDDVVFPAIESASTSRFVPKGLVEINVSVLTDEVVELLEAAFPGEPICLDGSDPADVVQPGPQPTEGDGWTLVGHQQKDGPPWFRTGVATDQAQLESLWTLAEMPGDAPAADFVENVVVWFADPHGSSCTNQRLDDVIVDDERSTIYPYIVDPDNPMMCTSDLRGAHHFFVALERDRLPSPPVWIQLGPWDPPEGAPKERTVVDVDLTAPGSVAKEGDVHIDTEKQPPQPERPGAFVEPRDNARYVLDASCGIGYLGEINRVDWVSEGTDVPAAWAGSVDDDGEIVVTVKLRGGKDPHVIATANGHSVRYEPVREAPHTCDA